MITETMVEAACRALATNMSAIPWDEYGEENRCDVRKGMRAALEAADAAAWQPIETAPKDGTDILVSMWEDHQLVVVSFDETQPKSKFPWLGVPDGPGYAASAPTHWRPLPEPPVTPPPPQT